jgi:acetyltransferase-like isoleucine patch superfamily enzyme
VGFNYGCYVNGYGGLAIGDRTIVGPYAMIHTANHEMDPERPFGEQGWTARPVEIGADCWFGMGACVLPGARIGDGCIVGAGSVVADDISPYTVAVGNPARVIKSRR